MDLVQVKIRCSKRVWTAGAPFFEVELATVKNRSVLHACGRFQGE